MTERSPEERALATMDKLGAEVVEANHGSEQDTNTDWSN